VFSTISLICSGPAAFADEATLQSLQMLAFGIENLPIEQVYDTELDHDSKTPGYVAPPEDVAAFLRKRFTSNVPTSLAEITRRLTDAEDKTDQLAKAGVRTQVLHGATDDGWPLPAQQAMAAALGVEAEVIPDAGHSPAIDQPAKTARMLVDFFHDYPSLRTLSGPE
jgi:pimeloyl-ACP methyl ester carboxylesterase